MAIFHFSAKVLKRSDGKNSIRAAAYRSAQKFTDPTTGEVFDYTRKKGVEESFILAPKNAPDWVHEREELWSQVEKIEKRKDAQLARDFDMALPVELNKAQQMELLQKFVQSVFVSRGMIADVNMHDLDSPNPHAHVMLTMREISPSGFGKKNRDWNEQSLMEDWREAWADHCNAALYVAGFHRIAIDHRSYERQSLDKVPTVHLGPAASKQEKAGTATPQGDHNRTAELVNELKGEIALDEQLEVEAIFALIKEPVITPRAPVGPQAVSVSRKPTEAPTPAPKRKPSLIEETRLEIQAMLKDWVPPSPLPGKEFKFIAYLGNKAGEALKALRAVFQGQKPEPIQGFEITSYDKKTGIKATTAPTAAPRHTESPTAAPRPTESPTAAPRPTESPTAAPELRPEDLLLDDDEDTGPKMGF